MSPDLVSTVTDAVIETVAEWQNRPLEASYPLMCFHALRVNVPDEGLAPNKAVYLALGMQADGAKGILVFGTRRARTPSSGSVSTNLRTVASRMC